MLRNYTKVALRTISKHKTFSFINIFGLALALTICMGIIMLVADQMMVDRHNTLSDRVYRINTLPYFHETNGRFEGNETATTTLPIRDELLTNYTGIESAVRILRGFGNSWLELEPNYDVNIPVSGYFADPEVLKVFQYELQYGNPETALVEPYSVVLTKDAAEKLFRVENPVGESIKVGKLGTYKVTGVMKRTEHRSHIVVDAFASISTVKSLQAAKVMGNDIDNWYNCFSGWVYILLEEGRSITDIESHLATISKARFTTLPQGEVLEATYITQNLLDIVPGRMTNNPIGPFMPWVLIYFFAGIAGIVLITSCFNFTNLSIARSITRAREIGVRKVTGAVRWQIFVQFIAESVIMALFALVLAVVFIYLLKPFIVDLAFARFLKWDLSANYLVYGIFVGLAVVVGIIAGLFPAGVLSGFQPIKVLKNLNNTRLMSKMGLRKGLLVIQFALSMIFILTVIVLFNQMNLFLHNDNGFAVENTLIIHRGQTNLEPLKAALTAESNVVSATAASHVPMVGMNYGSDFKRALEDKTAQQVNYFFVDEDYLTTMKLSLVAGDFFKAENGESNKNFIVLNETAAKRFEFETPVDAIGKVIIMAADSSERQIIGVVKDYHHELFSEQLRPMGLMYNPESAALLQVAYTGSYEDAVRTAEKAWTKINPGVRMDARDFEAELGKMYEIIFGTLLKVISFVAFLAITISCLGLLGMATYTIESRKKEIAMRKILGSSNRSLVFILSKGYLSVLLIALALAIPAAYFINTMWLQNLATHVTVDAGTILIGTFILILLGVFTIGSQTLQAIIVNPVENLKNE